MKHQRHSHFSKAAQRLLLFGLTASFGFAQSGDISGSTSNFTTLGTTILKLGVTLAGMGFVGLIVWGGLTLTTDRSRGLAMIGGGMVGALLAGLAFVIVNTLTGQTVQTGVLLLPAVQQCLLS
ncbi:MAG TPA: hypothetical protein VK638_46810 [Edaphobacter sp.]|nr:hypothetical protein [Edaphobacter sp.]